MRAAGTAASSLRCRGPGRRARPSPTPLPRRPGRARRTRPRGCGTHGRARGCRRRTAPGPLSAEPGVEHLRAPLKRRRVAAYLRRSASAACGVRFEEHGRLFDEGLSLDLRKSVCPVLHHLRSPLERSPLRDARFLYQIIDLRSICWAVIVLGSAAKAGQRKVGLLQSDRLDGGVAPSRYQTYTEFGAEVVHQRSSPRLCRAAGWIVYRSFDKQRKMRLEGGHQHPGRWRAVRPAHRDPQAL